MVQDLVPVDGFLADSFGPSGYYFSGDPYGFGLGHDQITGGDFDYRFWSNGDGFGVTFRFEGHRSTGHTNWTLTITPSAEPAVPAEPLPATGLLFGAGLVWPGSLRRKRAGRPPNAC